MRFKGDGLKIMDFDIEARPLSWYGGDWVSKEVTAIAWAYDDREFPEVVCVSLSRASHGPGALLGRFREAYDEADMVTGHYIRGFDLPVLNGAMLELGLSPLGDKLTQDTKLDLVKRSGLSVSQENLAATLGVESPKVQMNQAKWRAANRLTPTGVRWTEERVIGDVLQHIEMRRRLLALGMLRAPVVWSGNGGGETQYVP